MNKTAIVVCGNSGIDYLGEFKDVFVLRSILNLGDKEYEDFIDIKAEEFYDIIAKDPDINLSTSQTPVGKIREMFENIKNLGYKSIICITISSKLSGTVNAMRLAGTMVEDIDVYTIDSKFVSYVEVWMVLEAKRLLESGMDASLVASEISLIPERCRVYVCVDTLKFLVKNGRLNGVAGFLGSFLKLKPLLEFDNDGALVTKEKIRTLPKAKARTMEILLSEIKGKNIILIGVYTNNKEEVNALLEQVKANANDCNLVDVVLCPLTPVVGAHAGPGTFALGYIEIK